MKTESANIADKQPSQLDSHVKKALAACAVLYLAAMLALALAGERKENAAGVADTPTPLQTALRNSVTANLPTPNADGGEDANSTGTQIKELLERRAAQNVETARNDAARAKELSKAAEKRARALEAEAKAAEADAAQARAMADAAKAEAATLSVTAAAASEAAEQVALHPFGTAAKEEPDFSADMNGKALKRIPSSKNMATFSLAGEREAPTLDDAQRRGVAHATKAIDDAGFDAGFVFLDLASGGGVAYHAQDAFYTASAFKAAYAMYLIQRDGNIDGEDRENVEAAIRHSSNDAYDSLTLGRTGQGWQDWQERYGITYDAATPYYAVASARSMARIWADVFQYATGGGKGARWFADLLSHTNRSFIRDGLAPQKATVYNKAGWIGDDEYSATTDCAYIDLGGHPYLMVVLTDQPDSQQAQRRCADLAKALFSTRDALAG